MHLRLATQPKVDSVIELIGKFQQKQTRNANSPYINPVCQGRSHALPIRQNVADPAEFPPPLPIRVVLQAIAPYAACTCAKRNVP